jgi:hypothetical protein
VLNLPQDLVDSDIAAAVMAAARAISIDLGAVADDNSSIESHRAAWLAHGGRR